MSSTSEEKRVMVLVAHNLGDAVITLSHLLGMTDAMNGVSWHIWCRPEIAFLFERLPGRVEIITNRFPVGTNKQFTWRAMLDLARSIFRLRRQKFDLSFDLIGDFRDVALARLAGCRNHLSPVWPKGHPFRRIIRSSPIGWITQPNHISPECINVYEAYEGICIDVMKLLGGTGERVERREESGRLAKQQGPLKALRIGMHPFASQACKHWPDGHWRLLARELEALGCELYAFSAPEQRQQLRTVFGESLPEGRLICEPLPRFVKTVENLDLLIGLDSFSVHLAHLTRVPSLMLNGANDPRIWTPPTCTVVAKQVSCGNQPCMNKPTCIGTEFEYACMSSIEVGAVIEGLAEKLPTKRVQQ